MTDSVDKYVKERDEAFKNLDIEWGRKQLGRGDDHTILMALHKARIEVINMDEKLKEESRQWLRKRGYHLLHGGKP